METPLCPGFSVEIAGNHVTAHDMPCFGVPFSGNKWSSRDLTGLPKFLEINGNSRKLKDFKGINVTRKISFSLKKIK
jgi:hypothetical protein